MSVYHHRLITPASTLQVSSLLAITTFFSVSVSTVFVFMTKNQISDDYFVGMSQKLKALLCIRFILSKTTAKFISKAVILSCFVKRNGFSYINNRDIQCSSHFSLSELWINYIYVCS